MSIKKIETEEEVSQAFDRLFPICRSILGQGYRDSLEILKEYMPMEEEVFRSGEKVLNWTVPEEWVIREAWIKDAEGNTIIDFKENNLHVLNYSEPVNVKMELSELKKYIYTSPLRDAVPYVFSYYKRRWGFCMSRSQLEGLADGTYHAYIDSEFVSGRLVIGEAVLPGESEKEILLTSYLCHPSMANNELSGSLVLAMLYQRIRKWKKRKYTYRFLINPETIGGISYLSRYGERLKENMFGGIILTCLGGEEEKLRYKKSRQEYAPFDLLVDAETDTFRTEPFSPVSGSDERQYCSPGFNLPVGQIARKAYLEYEEYHTSLDTKELMGIRNIMDSCDKIEMLLLKNERESYYMNLYPCGEVKLGDYDLYPSINSGGSRMAGKDALVNEEWFIQSVMMILNYSDGKHPLSYCGKRLGIPYEKIKQTAKILEDRGLLRQVF